jgi:hypothetical protein
MGALLAVHLAKTSIVYPDVARVLTGSLGAALIVFSLVWVTEDMGFPGVNALPATAGAAMVVLAGNGKLIGLNRILGLSPFVLVGLISYSLYLWHWPVLAFYRYLFGNVDVLTGVLLFGLMLLCSVASYLCVEKPCRQLKWNFKQVTYRIFGAAGGCLVGLCVAIIASKGFGLYAFSPEYRASLKVLEPAPVAYSYSYVCQRPLLSDKELQKPECILNSTHEPKVLLWGDSNASHYVGMLGAFAEASGFSFRNAVHSACPPLLSGAGKKQKKLQQKNCLDSISTVKKYLGNYPTVILGAAWAVHSARNGDFIRDLERTVDLLSQQGKEVIILGQIPVFESISRKCPQKALKVSGLLCSGGDQERSPSAMTINSVLRKIADARENVEFYEVTDFLCPGGSCRAFHEGMLIYFDESHLSMEGSWHLGRSIVRAQGVPAVFSVLGYDHAYGPQHHSE